MKNVVTGIFSILLIMSVVTTSWSDEITKGNQSSESESQEDIDRDLEKMSKQMTPMFGNMVESMMQGKLKVFAQPETTTLLAKFVKNFYDDLIKEGFSKKEALQIVTSFGFPAIQ